MRSRQVEEDVIDALYVHADRGRAEEQVVLDSAQDGRRGAALGELSKDAATDDEHAGPDRLVQARIEERVGHEASTSSEVQACAISEHLDTLWRYGDGPLIAFNLFKITSGGMS
ncbi:MULTISPECIES: hypothetical protein [unclassified Kitasatospora]|uniref:hypothetical protein n=1 Tax=unclassified Kitasatospora TaxID=2633591 RepID=UPI000670A598|nr:hypothetical protein [Kitasatospora sp. MY 5-36]